MAEGGETYFLSYSRADDNFALRFAGDLRSAGIDVWVDQLNIRPSEHWDRAIERAVQACSGLIVILSPRSVESENVADEISFALNSGKKVIPVLIEACAVPLRVTRMHMIDATADYDHALGQCMAELGPQRGSTVRPAVIPSATQRAPAPIAPDEIARMSEILMTYLGPIAPMVVRREGALSSTAAEFRNRLAALIPVERERSQFLSRVAVSE